LDDVVLAGAVRTPIGKFGGALARLSAVELAATAGREALRRAGIPPGAVHETVLGHARQAGSGPNPGRQAAIACGIPVERPAYTINQACLSGMQAILAAWRSIRLGEAEVVLALGAEAMSRVPYFVDARWGTKMGDRPIVDAMVQDGFLDPMSGKIMGETAETLARQYGISREEQDTFAALSQNRCQAAWEEGRFAEEIVPMAELARDEHPRAGVTAASLSKLAPVFERDGTVSAGNSSGITDGAAGVVVLARATARRLGVVPQARIVGAQVAGVEPALMGMGPVPAVRRLVERTEIILDRMDLVELNEAFAAQVLAVDRELRFDRARLNVNGGSIALGHPIGCSGARIVVTLLHELRRREGRYGLATLCVSGGLGGALLLEREAAT
jgi:acetyl-CoA C-acetyltransferase